MTALKSRKAFALLALVLALVLAFSMLQLTVFAEEGDDALAGDGDGSDAVSDSAGDDAGDASDTVEDTTETEDTAEDTTATTSEDTSTGISTSTVITLIICGVLLVAAVVLVIRYRVKVFGYLGTIKSELKKIVWTKRKDVIKCSVVVLVVVVASAIIIGLLDFAFSKGIIALGTLF